MEAKEIIARAVEPHFSKPHHTLMAGEIIKALSAAGFVVVPKEPTEAMWGELARDIVMWQRMTANGAATGATLHRHLLSIRPGPVPEWLAKEIPDNGNVPPKGTVAACIYKAMIEAAP